MKFHHLHITAKMDRFRPRELTRAFMQYQTKTAWGLDISGCALKAVKITQASGRLQVEDMDIVEYPTPSSGANFLESPAIKEALQIFLARHHIGKTDKVLVSVSGQFVLSRFTTVPPVDKKQLRSLVGYEAKQQIPFDLKDIVWDYQELSEQFPGMDGIEIGLFAAKRATLDQVLTCIAPLKSRLNALQISPLAISNFIFYDQRLDGQTILINIDAENTDLIIVGGHYYWLRSIPVSSVDVDLVKEIQRSMEYYKSLAKEPVNFKTILLMGDRFRDPLNVKFITDNFAHKVKVLDALNNLKISDKINPDYFNENLLRLSTALGLALQGLGAARIKINLLPAELIREAEISRKKPYAVATLGCLTLSLIVQYGGFHHYLTRIYNSDTYYQKILQNVKEFEKKYKNAEALAQTNKSALDLVSSIDSARSIWMDTLDKLLSLMPNKVSITSIQSSWIDSNNVKTEDDKKQNPSGTPRSKKKTASAKPDASSKLLLMGIKGESKEPSIGFIEKHIVAPIRDVTFFDQKVAAFRNVEIVPGSCRQIDSKDGQSGYISFEIRWVVKSKDEIQVEENSLSLEHGTSTSSKKS